MPSLKAIRKRITSVRNTQKITRAMKLVAAAKLRRAQDAIIAARPYGRSLERLLAELAATEREAHPLFAVRKLEKASIVTLTSDRGLAGAFNASILRRVKTFIDVDLPEEARELRAAIPGSSDPAMGVEGPSQGVDGGKTGRPTVEVSIRAVGRKSNDFFKRRAATITSYDAAPTSASVLDLSHSLSNQVIDDFLEERVDRVYLIYNEFKSAISQGVVIKQILPIEPVEVAAVDTGESGPADSGEVLYEPSREAVLEHLAPLYIQIGFYTALLESVASELGARMTAMDNATRNAGEMISSLTLQYNRARQAAITKELMEIIGGAEALRG